MIVGKDWGTVDYFEKNKGKDDPKNRTNRRLIELIKLLGIEVSDCSQGQNTTAGLFLTNAVLCLKNANTSRSKKVKSMSAYVPKACFNNCQSLLLRTIETVNAKYIVSLGKDAFKAVLAAHKQPLLLYKGPYKVVVERRSEIQLGKRYLFPVCHTSYESANRRPCPDPMNADWIAIRERMEAIEAAQTL